MHKIKEKTKADFVNWYHCDDWGLRMQVVHYRYVDHQELGYNYPITKKEREEKEYLFKTKTDFFKFFILCNKMINKKNPFREKYKSDKRIEKLKQDTEKKIAKHKVFIEKQKQKAIEKAKNDISIRKEKQLARFLNQRRTQAEKKARAILGLKQTKKTSTKKSDSVKYWREKALAEFQLYSRIKNADSDGYTDCVVWDDNEFKYKLARKHYKKCNGGHIYSKHNYPHLAFHEDNCRPISPRVNEVQGDQVGQWQHIFLTFSNQKMLLEMSGMVTYEQKEKFQTKEYYQEQYGFWKKRNNEIKERLGLL